MTEMEKGMQTTLLTEQQLRQRVQELGKEVSAFYAGKDLLLITVLKGAVVFLTDFMRALDCHCELEFMVASSFAGGRQSTGVLKILKDIDIPIEGREVLIVEDILDSGLTLSRIKQMLLERGPASVRVVTLLDKPSRRKADIEADFTGFVIPDEFVVGYGLDYDEKYRNLPYIGILKPEVYTKGSSD